jgi:N-methylhydantoinase A
VAAVHPLGRPVAWRPAAPPDASLAPVGSRRAWLAPGGGWIDCPVYDRARLPLEGTIAGPAIVEQRETNTVLLAGQRATIHGSGALLVEEAR